MKGLKPQVNVIFLSNKTMAFLCLAAYAVYWPCLWSTLYMDLNEFPKHFCVPCISDSGPTLKNITL